MFIRIINCNPSEYEHDELRLEALTNIVKSSGKRKNIVYAKKQIMLELRQSPIYDINVRKYSQEIIELRNELGSIRKSVNFIVDVDFSNESLTVSNEIIDDRQYIISSSYLHFTSPLVQEGPYLLTENIKDSKLYELIGMKYLQNKFSRGIKISMQTCSGGGNTTYDTFCDMRQENKFTLCILDNDKSHPEKPEGDTSRRFPTSIREHESQQAVHILNVREVESLIPINILEQIVTSANRGINRPRQESGEPLPQYHYESAAVTAIDKIKQLDIDTQYEFRKYFDHKDGITLNTGLRLDKNRSPFWKNIFLREPTYIMKPCRTTNECVNTSTNQACECLKISGIGENILEQSIPFIGVASYSSIKNNLSRSIQTEWDILGQKVFSWGCALNLSKSRA